MAYMVNAMGNVTVEAPCCSSRRECHVRTKYVISLEDGEVVRSIDAVRCYRGEEKKYVIEASRPIAVVEHYVSNRGVHYITVEYSDWDKERTLEVVRHALGLETEEKIVV